MFGNHTGHFVFPSIAKPELKWKEISDQNYLILYSKKMAELINPGMNFLFPGYNRWEEEQPVPGRYCKPLLEKDGKYWGPPPDDKTALRNSNVCQKQELILFFFVGLVFAGLIIIPFSKQTTFKIPMCPLI